MGESVELSLPQKNEVRGFSAQVCFFTLANVASDVNAVMDLHHKKTFTVTDNIGFKTVQRLSISD